MTHPGVWILSDLDDGDRGHGMGVVVEYAGKTAKPQWVAPPPLKWSYARFAKPGTTASAPDETIEMTFAKENAAEEGFNRWSINGVAYPMTGEPAPATFHLKQGKRYRLRMRFELTKLAGRPIAGVLKDVMMLGGYPGSSSGLRGRQSGHDSLPLPSAIAHGFRLYDSVRLRLSEETLMTPNGDSVWAERTARAILLIGRARRVNNG